MRFCPFCGHDNSDEASECASCGKRLPATRAAPQRTPLPPPMQREPKPLPPRPLNLGEPAPAPAPAPKEERPSTLRGFKAGPTPKVFEQEAAPVFKGEAAETKPNTALATTALAPITTLAAEDGIDPSLPPMPPSPTTKKVIDAVKYLWPLWRAQRARRRAQDAIRNQLVDDQHVLDKILRELGRTAREVGFELPAIADEMARVKAHEATMSQADHDLAELGKKLEAEQARFTTDAAERRRQISASDGEIGERETELKARQAVRREHQSERDRLDTLIREAERKAAALDQKAQKADVTPPERGGGPHTAANARAEAEALRKEATAHIAPRDEAREEANELDGPIAVLTQQLQDLAKQQAERRQALQEAEKTHTTTTASLQSDEKRVTATRAAAERDVSQRFVAAGTLLNLKRAGHPSFTPIYAQIDDLKRSLVSRESSLVRLESERTTFDRSAVQRGLLTVGATATALILLILGTIILVASRH